ncbi:MAG: DNA-binding response regulator [Saprospiraceae bacterium]|nr:DNA-binding response regulator [Saprospiraceae bacterium]MCB9325659.1 DNA-binding response regulator [Lewinellaceae bacterium]
MKEISIDRKPIGSGIENPVASQNVDMEKAKTKEKPLILLVEDNPDVVAYVASCLGGYRLAVAKNGQEGYDIATEIIPDLIISDVMMPVMDGFEFCRKVKSDERTDHIPVIMLTARADMDSKIEGLELGANAYLPKPYEKQELLLTIRNLFELRDNMRRRHQNIAGLVDASEPKNMKEAAIEDPFVARVREMIEEHITDFNLNVDQLAKELYLSPSQFRRKLDALTGFSPNSFIRFLRLKKAKTLLQDPELSITAVAFDSGFSDPSYFTRVFKQEFGKTPVDWRMENPSEALP